MPVDLPTSSRSPWFEPHPADHPPLEGDQRADVAVVGAGIAGLTTAALLTRAGLAVTVLEGSVIGRGTTGHTTAKITALQGVHLHQVEQAHGADAARRYTAAQVAGLDFIAGEVEARSIDCRFERRRAVTYTTDPGRAATVAAEGDAARRAGLAALDTTDLDLPYPVAAGVVLADQAQFDPLPYLRALAEEVAAAPGSRVHEDSRVTSVHSRKWRGVRTAGGRVAADHVIVTTLLPVTDQGGFFARCEPKRSYGLTVSVDGPLPDGMFLGADEPTRTLRPVPRPDGGDPLLLVGGGGHVVGRKAPTMSEYTDLLEWARRHFPVTAVHHRWSAHDYMPVDELPFVGPVWSPLGGPMIATGFAKWGMTNGTAAALALADRVLDRPDGPAEEWAGLFDPARLSLQGAKTAALLNAGVAGRLALDWARPGAASGVDGDPAAGGARSGREGVRPVGETVVDGRPCRLSLVCPHLGGVVQWNDGERSWDCPLHGSRFAADGSVLDGPATRPLHRLDAGAS